MFAYSDASDSDVVIEAAPTTDNSSEKPTSSKVTKPAAKSSGDDFDFLLDDA